MSYRQLRKTGTSMDILKELIAIQQRDMAEKGIEDVTELRQGRVDFDSIAYTDTGGELDADKQEENTDAIAYTDSEVTTLQTSGEFTCALKDDGSDQSQPIKSDFFDVS